MSIRTLLNPNAGEILAGSYPDRAPLRFHSRLPGYEETPLVDAPGLADALGVGKVYVKDESSRLGLPAFKVLGASWAVYRALEERLGGEGFGDYWEEIGDLRERLEPLLPLSLVAATDGNHGRAVARVARLLGLGAKIFVPGNMTVARREAIAGEGAEVVVVEGTYDEAVERSAEEGEDGLVISDMSWPGYERIPWWVIEGYSTMLWEIEDELARRGEAGPDLVVVQAGVGAFGAAVARHFRSPAASTHPKLMSVEPASADCLLESVAAGLIVSVPGPHDSIMSGLNCGRPSLVAWPVVSRSIDLLVAVDDEPAREAMRLAAEAGVVSGETGAAGLGGLLELLRSEEGEEARRTLGVSGQTRVLLFNCEGATDPDAYRRIMAE
jgi:diaminopropionate ammonia-lyase